MYYMGIRELEFFWNRMEKGGRKSFRFEELKPEHFIKGKAGQIVPYLDMVQLDLDEREQAN
jgi:recombination protein U